LGTTVRDEVGRDPVEANNMLYKQLGGLRGSRELGEGNKVSSFGKPVHDSENDSVAIRGGKTGYKIKANVRPGPTRDSEGT
jgi:hypothetical protein